MVCKRDPRTRARARPRTFTKGDLCHCRHSWSIYDRLVRESTKTKTEVKAVSRAIGFGLFALEDIPEGQTVVECTGDRSPLSLVEMGEDKFNFDRNKNEYMIVTHSGKTTIDASMVKSDHIWKYINHACAPNCQYYTLNLAEHDDSIDEPIEVVFVYTLRKIRKGEQLTCSYNWLARKSLMREICRCGCLNCSGLVGVRGYPRVEEEVVDGEGKSGDQIGLKRTFKFKV